MESRARCLLCGSDDGAQAFALTYGISVVLCHTHRGDAYVCEDTGVTFADELAGAWRAAGCMTVRRRRALQAHVRAVEARQAPSEHCCPGSYAWPHMREEAERRFAAGEPPLAVMEDLRERHRGDAEVPALRTMRRWFAEGRWREIPPPDELQGVDRVFAAIDDFNRSFAPTFGFPFPGFPTTDRYGRPFRHRHRHRKRRRRR